MVVSLWFQLFRLCCCFVHLMLICSCGSFSFIVALFWGGGGGGDFGFLL